MPGSGRINLWSNMSKEETFYLAVGKKIRGAEPSQMFGKPCLKVNGKAFACFFENEMVFKLGGDDHKEALSLDGSRLFDPSGKGRAMKAWVQVPFDYYDQWEKFSRSAFTYVKGAK
jgi:hypothetical protein